MICPSCRQDAPTIVRGVRAYCTACGAPRPLLGSSAVNVAGRPLKVGGTRRERGRVDRAFRIDGSLAAGGDPQPHLRPRLARRRRAWSGLSVGGFFGVITLVVALSLLLGGRKLKQTGASDAARCSSKASSRSPASSADR